MSLNPSNILGLDRGTLKEDSIADVTVLDLDKPVVIQAKDFFSKARNCPFDGWELHGAAVLTIVGGSVVWSSKDS